MGNANIIKWMKYSNIDSGTILLQSAMNNIDCIREAAKKKRIFLGYLSQICLPTHPPQGFCEIWENER